MRLPSTRFASAATLALVIAAQVPGSAQSAPDLSGKYMFVKEKSTGMPMVPRIFNTTGAPAGSDQLVIAQTPQAVNVKIGEVDLTYPIEGAEKNISTDGRAGFPIGKAAWEGGRLVANLTQEVFSAAKGNYVKVPVKETYSMADGVLILERVRTHLDGKTTTEKLVYKKAS